MTEPQEPDPELDTLTHDQLHELGGPPGPVADVLDDWVTRRFGILSSHHGVGLFLDLLAAEGWRVTKIDPGPPIGELLPPPTE